MNKPESSFDLVIIGGGPAGYTAAIKGTLAGFKTAVVEKAKVGGACINLGCIPTKALWGTAVQINRLRHLKTHGILTKGGEDFEFDFSVASKRQFGIIERMVSNIEKRMQRLGVTTIAGEGFVESKKSEKFQIRVQNGSEKKILEAKFVLICTGSRPSSSDILKPDHQKIITTDEIVTRQELPKRLVIVGGGIVACEFASILYRFGVQTEILEHSSQVLSAMDQEVVSLLMDRFQKDGIKIHLHTTVSEFKTDGPGVIVKLNVNGKPSDKVIDTDMVLLAIGRKPNSEDLGLEELGVKITPRGHIVVDDCLQTACKGLYAAGDVVGGQMLAHKAWYDAEIAIRAMSGEECKANYDTVPGAIFTIPEMASVGLQPDQARQKGISIAIGKFDFEDNAQAMCLGFAEGMMKTVINRDTGKIIGATIYGRDASNLISEIALAMANDLTAKDVIKTIHPHPTLSEIVWEATADTLGLSLHKT